MPEINIVLVEPEIHWNTGNAGRTCLAADAKLHLVGPLGFSLDAREVKRAGLDYWPKVDPRVWSDWTAFAPHLATLGTPFFFSPDGTRNFWDIEYPERCVLLFGRESVGFSSTLRAHYRDHLFSIPQLEGSVRSLNVSTCVGIVLYEIARQRRVAEAQSL